MTIDASKRHAAVVGAGIGGLAAAIALRQAGWEATVYEAAPELRPLGAGLSIWPNGVRALRELGLGDLAAAAPRADGALRRADGLALAKFDPDVLEARFGAPLVGFHRADLHRGLIEALGAERVKTGKRLRALEDGELRFADGSTVGAGLVVGADGVSSTVRAALLDDGEPRDSGIVAFRGVAALDDPVPAGEWWGSGSVAGLLELGGGRVYWYLAYRGEPDRSALPGLLAEYGEPVRKAFRQTDEEQVLVHRLYDRDPTPSWSRGTVTLLGDAAHPMLPFLGQGANAALEDAAALRGAVRAEGSAEVALAAYERARLSRTAALVAGSRKAAKAALLGSGAGRWVRNALVSKAPEAVRLRQLDPFISSRA
ncbi:MAG TPA: FAD-dependent monooxygenase [Solirubrobacterales bacterium]|nr:FAD-dependent monooxygenase [Solirubrobacterales bacterium]